MGRVNSRVSLVGVVIVALANAATAWAQSDEFPRRGRERITRSPVDDDFPSVASAAFDTEVKITPSDGAVWDLFGISVAIDGDTALVGARFGDCNGKDTGSAYFYQRDQAGVDTWVEVTKITASDGAQNDSFGWRVAISADTAIVGAFWDDDNGFDSGSAYLYRRDVGGLNYWGEVTKITASDGTQGDHFGVSVSIDGDTAIVGAWHDDDKGGNSGSAYVYVSSGCTAAGCDDDNPCTFDRCVASACLNTNTRYGDVAGPKGVCGPDGGVDLWDMLAALDGFAGQFAEGCALVNIDIAGAGGGCEPDDSIDLADILGVLDALQGVDNCCGNRR